MICGQLVYVGWNINMAIGVTKHLFEYTGLVGKCDKGHVVKILTNGFGFCPDCTEENDLNHTLWAPPGFVCKVGSSLEDIK